MTEAQVLGVLRRLASSTGDGYRSIDTPVLARAAETLLHADPPPDGYLAVNTHAVVVVVRADALLGWKTGD